MINFLKVFVWLILLIFLTQGISYTQELQRYQFQSRHMGTHIGIILYAENDSMAKEASDAAFYRIEELNQIMSDYIEESELNRLSRLSGSGEWLEIRSSLFDVLMESVRISEKTGGLFDVTIGPMTHHWRNIRMMPDPQLPDQQEIEFLKNKVGYQHIMLDKDAGTARLMAEDMQLDLGGIAKGYAAKEALKILNQHGIHSALVDVGRDITLGNPPPGRSTWNVTVPKGKIDDEMVFATLHFSNKTLTTSGDMYQFVEINGKRYSHILNPVIGLGADKQIQATVISTNSMYADAFASALTLMEPEEAICLIETLDETEAVILMEVDNSLQEWISSGIPKILKQDY